MDTGHGVRGGGGGAEANVDVRKMCDCLTEFEFYTKLAGN